MKQFYVLKNNKPAGAWHLKVAARLKQVFFSVILVCLGTFFIQAEDDETGMYILLIAVIVIVGLVNLVRWIFPKNHRRRDKHGHKDEGHGHMHEGGKK